VEKRDSRVEGGTGRGAGEKKGHWTIQKKKSPLRDVQKGDLTKERAGEKENEERGCRDTFRGKKIVMVQVSRYWKGGNATHKTTTTKEGREKEPERESVGKARDNCQS